METKEYYMREALKAAQEALLFDEVPVGAVIVYKGEIIARGFNTRETSQIATHHAEIKAIEEACRYLGSWRLDECEMYVTLEPCMMCAGALILSRIKKVYIGAIDPKAGAVVSVERLLDEKKYNHKVEYEYGILEEECSLLLKEFFRNLRKRKNLE